MEEGKGMEEEMEDLEEEMEDLDEGVFSPFIVDFS